MTAREYLSQARYLNAHIDAKLEQIERLRALAERSTAAYGHSVGSGGAGADRRADIVAKIIDKEREIGAEVDSLMELKREIEAVIARLPDRRMCVLLELRYLNGLPWAEVARRMNYNVRNVYRLHEAALKKLSPNVTSECDIV